MNIIKVLEEREESFEDDKMAAVKSTNVANIMFMYLSHSFHFRFYSFGIDTGLFQSFIVQSNESNGQQVAVAFRQSRNSWLNTRRIITPNSNFQVRRCSVIVFASAITYSSTWNELVSNKQQYANRVYDDSFCLFHFCLSQHDRKVSPN